MHGRPLLVASCLLLAMPAVVADNSSALHVDDEGSAGEWAFYQYRFPAPVPNVPIRGSFVLVVESPADGPPRALFQPPAATFLHAGASVFPEGHGAPRVRTGEAGVPLRIELHAAFGAGGADMDSVVLLAAANAEWRLEVRMDGLPASKPLVEPQTRVRGAGATFLEGAPGPIDELGVASLAQLDAQVASAGWSHFQIETPWRALAARDLSVDFPNGTAMSHKGAHVSTFAAGPRGVDGSRGDFYDAYGVMEDRAGTFRAALHDVEAAAEVRLSLVHLPMETGDLPASVPPKSYRGTEDRAYWLPPGARDLPRV